MGAFDLTVGAVLLGASFNMYLYGFVSYQYLAYKTTKFNDPIWLRAIVAVLFVIDTTQTIVELHVAWFLAVENYANPSVLARSLWGMSFCSSATTISALIVQAFLITRLGRLTRQYWLCIFLILVGLAACVIGITGSIQAGLLADVTKFNTLIPQATAWLSMEASVDILITAILSRALWRSKTGFARTNTIVNRCIRAAIQSGLFSSICAILNLLAFVFWTETFLFTTFNWPLGRIYSNSLLYTLVARKEFAAIASASSAPRDSGLESFPMSPPAAVIPTEAETTYDSKGNALRPNPLDQYIVFRQPQPTIVTV
ncbi:hypothetical protein DL96DRAFT_1586640 [Flagelloscypha sp. PMI_526]|nr:hypothetical protein DL96DRAFT_1586640 [Flagelloscypha sp. PMI_526]